MVETAPSRISPTPNGRSGMTPGFAAGGGPPQPWPQPPGPPTGPPPGGVPRQPGPGGGGGTWPWSGAPGGPVGADHWLGGGCSFDHFTPGPSGVRSGCPGCAGCPAGPDADGS